MKKTLPEIIRLIKENKSFLIVSHINPEGDATGSSIALALGLKKLGKKDICILGKDPVPEILKFLPSSETITLKPPVKKYDVLFILDCNTVERTGFKELKAKNTVIIDHHIQPAGMDKSWLDRSLSAALIDPEAAATGMLVYKLLTVLRVSIDKDIATCLYTAILMDTGGFRYSNTSPASLRMACQLVAAGAMPWDITKEIYESIPYKSMKLLGISLSTLDRKDGIAWLTATGDMFKKTGTTAEDTEDFVDFPRKVKDIEVAVFFRQDDKDAIKISLRSKGRVNVQEIAKSFGGGGHFAAAGWKIKGTLQEVQKKVFMAVRKAIKNAK